MVYLPLDSWLSSVRHSHCIIIRTRLTFLEAACVRLGYVIILVNSKDVYYSLADSLNWSSIEAYVGKIFFQKTTSIRGSPAD